MTLLAIDTLLQNVEDGLRQHLADKHIENALMVGIHTGGVWVAQTLHQRLGSNGFIDGPLGTLDISFYRDDFTRIGLNPKVKTSDLPVATEDRHIILVDDVVMSGRTVRAALNLLFEYGRPASVTLAALVDLNARDLPIRADVIGQELSLPTNQRIQLSGPEPLKVEVINV